MATRLYFGNVGPSLATTNKGGWNSTTSAVSKGLTSGPAGVAATIPIAESSNTNNYKPKLGQWTSPPLQQAYSFSSADTFSISIGALQSSTSAYDTTCLYIWVTNGETDTNRGAIYTLTAGGSEWPTSAASVYQGSVALNGTVSAQAGDRIVVEVGYNAADTSTASFTGTMNYGNTGTTPLNAADGDTAVTTRPGWIEFSPDLLFGKGNSTKANIRKTVTAQGWLDATYQNRIKLTVPAAKVTGTHTGFAIYVNLANLPAEFHSNVAANGADIRITTADGMTEVPREVVFYDAATDTGELHFKGDITSASDTVFYLYYKNTLAGEPAANSTYGSQNVWTGYSAVYHMTQDPSGTAPQILDSTANALHATSNGSMTSAALITDGKIGKALEFNGSQYLTAPSNVAFEPTTLATMEAWAYHKNVPTAGTYTVVMCHSNTENYVLDSENVARSTFDRVTDGWSTVTNTNTPVTQNNWFYMAGVYNNTENYIHVNDSALYVTFTARNISITASKMLYIGARENPDRYFTGYIDEVRFKKTAMTDNEKHTRYDNQVNPSAFYTLGAQETPSGNQTKANIRVNNNTVANSTKAFVQIWTFNITKANSAIANIAGPPGAFVKANIGEYVAGSVTQPNNTKANVTVTLSVNQNTKSSIVVTVTGNNSTRANLYDIHTQDQSLKANIVSTVSKPNSAIASVVTTGQSANSTKANIVVKNIPVSANTKSSIVSVTSVANNTKANVRATYLNGQPSSYVSDSYGYYDNAGYYVSAPNIYGYQSFTGNGSVLKSVTLRISSPTGASLVGNMYAKIYSHSGVYGTSSVGNSLLATSDAIAANTTPGAPINKSFTFSGAEKILLGNGTYYVVGLYYDLGNQSDRYVIVYLDVSSPTHAGNAGYLTSPSTWTAQNGSDLYFQVYTDNDIQSVKASISATVVSDNSVRANLYDIHTQDGFVKANIQISASVNNNVKTDILRRNVGAPTETVDQSNYSGTLGVGFGDTGNGRAYMGQGFKPTGTNVSAISFNVDSKDGADIGYRVWIDTADANSYPTHGIGGIGGDTLIYNAQIVINALTKYTLSSPIAVTPGNQYVVVVAPWNTTTNTWTVSYHDIKTSVSNPYADGRRIHLDDSYANPTAPDSGNADIVFETYTIADSSTASSVKASIVVSNSDGSSVKTNVKTINTANGSAKASVVVTNTNPHSAKASVVATATIANQSIACILSSQQKGNSAKASVIAGSQLPHSVTANILVANTTSANSTKASIVLVKTFNNNTKANVIGTGSADGKVKASVVTTVPVDSVSKGDILRINDTVNNMATASVVNTVTDGQNTLSNIVGTISKQTSTKASIMTIGQSAHSAKANIFVANIVKANSVKINIKNASPTVTLGTPTTGTSVYTATPTFTFTGTDAEGSDVRYNIQVRKQTAFANTSYYSDANLVSYYALDGNVTDAKSAINGSIGSGASYTTSVFDRGVTSDGTTNGYINLTNNSAFNFTTGDFTIAFRLTTNGTAAWSMIFCRGYYRADGYYFQYTSSGNAMFCSNQSGTNQLVDATNLGLVDGVPKHIAVVKSGTQLYIYANGELTTTSATRTISNPVSGTRSLEFFRYADGSFPFKGTVDDIHILNRACSQAEVKDIVLGATILDKTSGTDGGFTGAPDNTDPFTSGQQVSYTVQAGGELSSGQYMWRVRGIDPNGSNAWGAWATENTVTVVLTYTNDNSVKAFIQATTTTADNSSKSNITIAGQNDNSVKARIVVGETRATYVTADILAVYEKQSSVVASIVTTSQVAGYVKTNIVRFDETISGNTKASVVVTNTDENNVKSSVVVTATDSNNAKASVVVRVTYDSSAMANILVITAITQIQSTKANIVVTVQQIVATCTVATYPTNAASEAPGTVSWNNTNQVYAEDGSVSSTPNFNSVATNRFLRSYAYGFAIPLGATITGILAEIKKATSSDTHKTDKTVQLYSNGYLGSNYKSATGWSSTLTWASYGGTTDTWGRTWTATEINDATFGVGIQAQADSTSCNAQVDAFRITVCYSAIGGSSATANILVQNAMANSVTASISSPVFSGSSVTANILARVARDSNTKASIVVTSAYDGSTKASVVTTPTDDIAVKTNIVAPIEKEQDVLASIYTTGQTVGYVKTNIFRANEQKSNNAKTSIVVIHTNSINTKSSIVVTVSVNTNVKSDIYRVMSVGQSVRADIKQIYTNGQSTHADIVRFGENVAQNTKANIYAVSTYASNVKASIVVRNIYGQSTKSDILRTGEQYIANVKASIVVTVSYGQSTRADILVAGIAKSTNVKASVRTTPTDGNNVKASIVVTRTGENTQKTDIVATIGKNSDVMASIMTGAASATYIKANIFKSGIGIDGAVKSSIVVTATDNQSAKAHIYLIQTVASSSKADITVIVGADNSTVANVSTGRENGSSVKANIISQGVWEMVAKADIVAGMSYGSVTTANIIFARFYGASVKASVVRTETGDNSTKAWMMRVVEWPSVAVADILRIDDAHTNVTKANVTWVDLVNTNYTKAMIYLWIVYRSRPYRTRTSPTYTPKGPVYTPKASVYGKLKVLKPYTTMPSD